MSEYQIFRVTTQEKSDILMDANNEGVGVSESIRAKLGLKKRNGKKNS